MHLFDMKRTSSSCSMLLHLVLQRQSSFGHHNLRSYELLVRSPGLKSAQACQLVALTRLQSCLGQEPKFGLHRPIHCHRCMFKSHLPHNATAIACNTGWHHTSEGGVLQYTCCQSIVRQCLHNEVQVLISGWDYVVSKTDILNGSGDNNKSQTRIDVCLVFKLMGPNMGREGDSEAWKFCPHTQSLVPAISFYTSARK